MTDPVLSAEIAELVDLALVHSVRVEVLTAAAVLQDHPLDGSAATRMQRALQERLPSAQLALRRLQDQRPLPGSVTRGPAGLLSVEGTGTEQLGAGAGTSRTGAPHPHRYSRPSSRGGAL